MVRCRREASTTLLLLIATVLLSCAHVTQAADWLSWVSAPVRHLFAPARRDASTTSQESCPAGEPKTCPNGMTLARQPDMACQFPECPDKAWPVFCDPNCNGEDTCEQHCGGEETQSIVCPEAVACPTHPDSAHDCTPRDCKFGAWTEWGVEGCSGVCNRTRTFTENACGGFPCTGRLHETTWCASPCNPSVDCLFDVWSPWGVCDAQSMRHRSRIIKLYASGDGSTCEGPLEDTQSCTPTFAANVDCKLSEWMSWSGCTETCGGGQSRRIRGIATAARYGGKPCSEASLMEVKSCDTAACVLDLSQAKDCQMGTWTVWSACDAAGTVQRSRSRGVAIQATAGGTACNGTLEEIGACPTIVVTSSDCSLAQWSPWSACSKTCDSGQTFRHRTVQADPQNGGKACQDSLTETKVCAAVSCSGESAGNDNCLLTTWGRWSGCSETCGQGMETRMRQVQAEAHQGGKGCADAVTEVRGCPAAPACTAQDCRWAEWTVFSQCSKSCGKGTASRTRVVHKAPIGDGRACKPLDSTLELKICNAQDCPDECVDGVWGLWTPWSACTRSCGGGAQWRQRGIAKQANSCGNPANGSSSEFQACSTKPCKGEANCELSPWTKWSTCSKACGGSQTRSRSITVNSTGAGRACQDDLSQLKSCDASGAKECGTEVTDCQLAAWSDWSYCSVTCEGGQAIRSRKVAVHASNGGKLCNSSVEEAGPCQSSAKCEAGAKDCRWSPWAEWAPCSECDGERVRLRQITQYPDHGVACDAGALKEVGMCQRNCQNKTLYYCVWDKWTSGPCSSTCGKSARTKIRHLSKTKAMPSDKSLLVGKLHADWETCNASQEIHEECAQPACLSACVPKDCSFSDWTPWVQPTGSDCNGLCTRNRTVLEHSNECGASCQGATIMTKPCLNAACKSQDCEWTAWSKWNDITCQGTVGQKFRTRDIKSKPRNGGSSCTGSKHQTASCSGSVEPVPCEFSIWGMWGSCDRTCGAGKHFRDRTVTASAKDGGQPCSGPMRMVKGCSTGPCDHVKADCKLSEWTIWFGCNNNIGDQAYRTRLIMVMAAGGGLPCAGSLKETGECGPLRPANCVIGKWNDWGDCDATCGGGQMFKTREVQQEAQNGGLPCGEQLHMTGPCNTDPCASSTNCEVAEWAVWSSCDPACGQGVQKRSRAITQAPADGAIGCNLVLNEVKACKSASCPGIQDCEVSAWSDWGACQKAVGCGVGFRERTRKVKQGAGADGHPCEAGALVEAVSHKHCLGTCHENCVNGEWQAWQDWSACSVSCGNDGKRSRVRSSLLASHCGFPAEGPNTEFEGCSSPSACEGHKDCVWTAWTAFQACSSSCSGSQSRTRAVQSQAALGGKPCHGGIVEVARCSPADGESTPPGCPSSGVPEDCKLEVWTAWSVCSRPCEGGYQTRHRAVINPPANGGKSCNSTLREIKPCGEKVCTQEQHGQECAFAAWQMWSKCDAHTGSRARQRGIAVKVIYGKDCQGSTTEVEACKTDCDMEVKHYCVWSTWSIWSGCSKTCGPEGRLTRTRKLAATREAADDK